MSNWGSSKTQAAPFYAQAATLSCDSCAKFSAAFCWAETVPSPSVSSGSLPRLLEALELLDVMDMGDAAGDAGDLIKTVRGAGCAFNIGPSALRH